MEPTKKVSITEQLFARLKAQQPGYAFTARTLRRDMKEVGVRASDGAVAGALHRYRNNGWIDKRKAVGTEVLMEGPRRGVEDVYITTPKILLVSPKFRIRSKGRLKKKESNGLDTKSHVIVKGAGVDGQVSRVLAHFAVIQKEMNAALGEIDKLEKAAGVTDLKKASTRELLRELVRRGIAL